MNSLGRTCLGWCELSHHWVVTLLMQISRLAFCKFLCIHPCESAKLRTKPCCWRIWHSLPRREWLAKTWVAAQPVSLLMNENCFHCKPQGCFYKDIGESYPVFALHNEVLLTVITKRDYSVISLIYRWKNYPTINPRQCWSVVTPT